MPWSCLYKSHSPWCDGEGYTNARIYDLLLLLGNMARIVNPWLAIWANSLPLVAGKSLWSTVPAQFGVDDAYILKTGYLIGNGKLGGKPTRIHRVVPSE